AASEFAFQHLIYLREPRKWRNWQTHRLEGAAPKRHTGSSPVFRTKDFHTRTGAITPSSTEPFGKQPRMQILFYFVIVLHVIVCFFLIGVVLLQQGRSADLAGAFGGQGSQTAFGPRAAANVLTRLTTWSAIIFMLTSISLVILVVPST